jgi:TonB family protein
MGKLGKTSYFLVGFIIISRSILAAEDILIQVHLFRSEWKEGMPHPQQVEVLTTSSQPEMALLKEKAAGSENQLTAATIAALMDIYALGAVDDLFLHEKSWSGLRSVLLEDVIQGPQYYYRIKLTPKRISNQQIALRIVITRGKTSVASAETLIEKEIALDFNEPAIVVGPQKGEAFFAMALIKAKGSKTIEPKSNKALKTELVAIPRVLHEVQPSYPEELRRRRIGGVVGLLVQIDEKGTVMSVSIEQPGHSYLNYSAVQAMRQWTFEPVLIKGKAAPARFRFSFSFYPSAYEPVILSQSPWPETGPFSPDVLQRILDQCAEYCRKLAGAALDFFCEETIKETHFSMRKGLKWKTSTIMVSSGENYEDRIIIPLDKIQIMDPAQTKRNNFLCDYQIVRKDGVLKERRILLKENGRPNADRTKLLEESRVTGLSPLFAPLKVLLPNRQPKFFFRVADEEKVQGLKAYVVEASPKSGDEDGIWAARIWVDPERSLILKCEIEGIPIDGYEDVLDDCAVLNIRPEFITTHEYRIEKGGVLFPWRSKVRIAYPEFGPAASLPKDDIVLTYANYRFFIVETEPRIIK